MFRNTKSKLLRTVSILLLISGLSIIIIIILTLSFESRIDFLRFLTGHGFDIAIGMVETFYLYEAGISRIMFPLILIGLALIDLLCSFFIYKGNKVFWWIATIRSLFTTLSGAAMIFLSFTGGRVDYMSIIEAIGEPLTYFIYYGVIFILLIMSRKTLLAEKGEN